MLTFHYLIKKNTKHCVDLFYMTYHMQMSHGNNIIPSTLFPSLLTSATVFKQTYNFAKDDHIGLVLLDALMLSS